MNERLRLRIKKIIRETDDAATYILENFNRFPVLYRSGQFLTFILNFENREVRRSYSIASSPVIDNHIAVTIKRVVNGEISRYLLDHLKCGDVIQSLYPAGRFTIETDIKNHRTYFFFAAGSGITPIYSLIKTLLHEEPFGRIILIYSNKSERATIFYSGLKELESAYQYQLKCIFLFSEKGERLSNSTLEKLVIENIHREKANSVFYTCGPFDYMRMVMLTLIYMGISKTLIHKEHFASEFLEKTESKLITGNPVASDIQIFFNNKIYDVTVPPYKSILDAALAQNIFLPYSCRAGVCSTCEAICKNGKVEMTVNEVLTDNDLSHGWILTCTGYPIENNTVIEFVK